MKRQKKGVSPVIATVLLISMVIILGVIIFLWIRSFMQETVTKFGDENIENACGKVSYTQSINGGNLTISNRDIPIYRMKVVIYAGGSHSTEELPFGPNQDQWPQSGLAKNAVTVVDVGDSFDDATKVELIPVLLGNSDNGRRIYACTKHAKTII